MRSVSPHHRHHKPLRQRPNRSFGQFAAAIRGTVAHDLQIGGYFGDDGEPIDEDKVDIVESLIDKFFVE